MHFDLMYEVQRKADTFRETKATQNNSKVKKYSDDIDDIWEIPEENFDNEYQPIYLTDENDEDYIGADIEKKSKPPEAVMANMEEEEEEEDDTFQSVENLRLTNENLSKFHLSLSSEKIRLKMPITAAVFSPQQNTNQLKTEMFSPNKSMAATANTVQQWKHIKLNENNINKNLKTLSLHDFTMVPISLNTKQGQVKYAAKIDDSKNEEEVEGSEKQPEIKLTSFARRHSAANFSVKNSITTNPFRTSTIYPRRRSSLSLLYTKRSDFKTKNQPQQQDACCTSPEAILDNILSAASSMSVQSSSLSSNDLPDMPEEIEPINENASPSTNPFSLRFKHPLPILKITPVPDSPNSNDKQDSNYLPKSLVYFQTATEDNLISTGSTSDSVEVVKKMPSTSPARKVAIQPYVFPDDLKCLMCANVYKDPRCLNCLHSFCLECLVDESIKEETFWLQSKAAATSSDIKNQQKIQDSKAASQTCAQTPHKSDSRATSVLALQQRRKSSFTFMDRKHLDCCKNNSNDSSQETHEDSHFIICKQCQFPTEVPVGGLKQLPQNFILQRKIENLRMKMAEGEIIKVWCSLCSDERNATYYCLTCALNMCSLCKEFHEGQKSTGQHKIRNIIELRRLRDDNQSQPVKYNFSILVCGMHPEFEIKSFCTNCLQVACTDCLILQHRGHRHEPIERAIMEYGKILKDSTEQMRPLCNYAQDSIEKLHRITNTINRKCDDIQRKVEEFMRNYVEAIEIHRKLLLQEIQSARECKLEIILEQQKNWEKHTADIISALQFSSDLLEVSSDAEILSYIRLLLKRFEYCQTYKTPPSPRASDCLQFLPDVRAPFTMDQRNIPIFGIITTQIVESALCTLEWEGFLQLRLHKKAEFKLICRDANNIEFFHGGLKIKCIVRYKEFQMKFLPVEVTDNRDGTYIISFMPDINGTVILSVKINGKPIKSNPFTFVAREATPHSGQFHCCTFCSSNGNKKTKCGCNSQMPGYSGCGHGHEGHPGRRHWSCCGNVSRNSDCTLVNKMLNL